MPALITPADDGGGIPARATATCSCPCATSAEYASDGEMAAAIEDADDVITGHATAVARLATETTTGLDDARDALDDAHAERDNARAMAVSVPCDGCHGARAAAIAAAQQHIGGAEDRIAYAEAAARVLDTAAKRLRRALTCLRRVTTDLAETYEAVYDLRHCGQVMPKDGDWLTGAGAGALSPRASGRDLGKGPGRAAGAQDATRAEKE
jgi:hypothetical protein